MGIGSRSASCLLALLAAAAFLTACGGGSDSTAAGTATQASSPGHPKGEARERAAYEKARYGSPSPQSAPFSKYSGKGEAKLHLAEFGAEATSAERSAAQAVLAAYLQASGAGDWEGACSYLSAPALAEIARLSKASGGSCGEALPKFAGASEEPPGLSSEGLASLRIEQGGRAGEGTGFALFHGSTGSDYWMAMKIENGAWKAISIAPQPFDATWVGPDSP